MGCTGSVTKDETNFGYMQKETLYYKIKDKNQSSPKSHNVDPPKDMINQMINESISSDNSDSESSNQEIPDDKVSNKNSDKDRKANVLYKHKPTRPSKLKEIQQSGSKYDKSDRKYEKENETPIM